MKIQRYLFEKRSLATSMNLKIPKIEFITKECDVNHEYLT